MLWASSAKPSLDLRLRHALNDGFGKPVGYVDGQYEVEQQEHQDSGSDRFVSLCLIPCLATTRRRPGDVCSSQATNLPLHQIAGC